MSPSHAMYMHHASCGPLLLRPRRVFRSRLLEATRRGVCSSVSFLGIAGCLSRAEAAKAFYQVLGAHAARWPAPADACCCGFEVS